MNNVISHPAFEREPIINERRPGRPTGTVSLATRRRKRRDELNAEITPEIAARQRKAETDAEKVRRLQRDIDDIAVHLLNSAHARNMGEMSSHLVLAARIIAAQRGIR